MKSNQTTLKVALKKIRVHLCPSVVKNPPWLVKFKAIQAQSRRFKVIQGDKNFQNPISAQGRFIQNLFTVRFRYRKLSI
jgi:hypothetical protein